MALFRSDILNQDFFRKAVQSAERTSSVDILELTIGDSKTGLQETAPVHITAEVRGRRRELCWSAKISPPSEAAQALGRELRLWEKEVFVYKELLPAIELRSNKLHLAAPAHADLVYADIEEEDHKALLFTDLGLAGFEPGSSGCGADPVTIELLVTTLAKLHAHGYDFMQSSSDKSREILSDSVPLAGRRMASEEGLEQLVSCLDPPTADYSSRLRSLFSTEVYFSMCRAVFGPRTDQFCVPCHGAPWLENSLVWRDQADVREAVYVNYQHARHCQPATDLCILLYTSTSRQFRREHVSHLLRGYHRTLMETLTALGHTDSDIYPFSELFQDYQDAIIPCVGVAVTALPGLVREAQDEVDTPISSEDRPGVTAGRTASDRIRDILEELVEDGRM